MQDNTDLQPNPFKPKDARKSVLDELSQQITDADLLGISEGFVPPEKRFANMQPPPPDANEFPDTGEVFTEPQTGYGTYEDFLRYALRDASVQCTNELKLQHLGGKSQRTFTMQAHATNDAETPITVALEISCVMDAHNFKHLEPPRQPLAKVGLHRLKEWFAATFDELLPEFERMRQNAAKLETETGDPMPYIACRKACRTHQTRHIVFLLLAMMPPNVTKLQKGKTLLELFAQADADALRGATAKFN